MAQIDQMPRNPARERPLSPHLAIYKPSITMVTSILHRITGAALFFGTLLLAAFLVALASGKEAFTIAQGLYGSWLGRLILFGYSWALFQHMFGGVRHFIWDTGAGLARETRLRLAWLSCAAALALTALVWLVHLAS